MEDAVADDFGASSPSQVDALRQCVVQSSGSSAKGLGSRVWDRWLRVAHQRDTHETHRAKRQARDKHATELDH
eukprot:1859508-Rhodomonas_salina.1